jgi:hypothetical protein
VLLALQGHKDVKVPYWFNILLMAEAFGQLPWVVAPSSKGSHWWMARYQVVQRLRAEIKAEEE